MGLHIFDTLCFAKLHLLKLVWNFDYIFDVLEEIIGKIIDIKNYRRIIENLLL